MQNGTRISCRGPALSATARSSAVYLHLLAPSPGHLTPTTVQTGRWPSRGLDMVLDTHWIRRTPRFRPPSPAAAAAAALQRQRRTEAATATPHAARRSEAGGRPPDRARGSHVCELWRAGFPSHSRWYRSTRPLRQFGNAFSPRTLVLPRKRRVPRTRPVLPPRQSPPSSTPSVAVGVRRSDVGYHPCTLGARLGKTISFVHGIGRAAYAHHDPESRVRARYRSSDHCLVGVGSPRARGGSLLPSGAPARVGASARILWLWAVAVSDEQRRARARRR